MFLPACLPSVLLSVVLKSMGVRDIAAWCAGRGGEDYRVEEVPFNSDISVCGAGLQGSSKVDKGPNTTQNAHD